MECKASLTTLVRFIAFSSKIGEKQCKNHGAVGGLFNQAPENEVEALLGEIEEQGWEQGRVLESWYAGLELKQVQGQ